MVLLGLGHRPILQAVALPLTLSDQRQRTDYIWIVGGDRDCETAAGMIFSGLAQRVLMVEDRPRRTVELGILPSDAQDQRRLLHQLGIPGDLVEIIDGDFRQDWREALIFREWLHRRPQITVTVLCDELGLRQSRLTLARLLDPDDLVRVRFVGLADRQVNPDSWWTSRGGWKKVFAASFGLTYTFLFGPDEHVIPCWTAEEYEKNLQLRWLSKPAQN